uniref:Major histocompatibility complex class I-related gene protein-like n=1 Tax=Callorhinchus milii TaxID=7868 RepID=A0A4W3H761_CALMI
MCILCICIYCIACVYVYCIVCIYCVCLYTVLCIQHIVCILCVCLHCNACVYCVCVTEPHSLRYYYTAMYSNNTLPTFSHVGMLDDVQITRYDSERPHNRPTQPWMGEALKPDEWESETVKLSERQKLYLANVKIAMRRSNINTGLNVFQYMSGCQLLEDGSVRGFRSYAFNGRDLLSFDMETLTWVASSPIARLTKEKWDRNGPENLYKKTYSESICVNWLRKYLHLQQEALDSTVKPKVTVRAHEMVNSLGHRLACLVTGFYTRDVRVTWRRGQDVPETTNTGIIPNHDSTFQITSYHDTSPPHSKDTYCCHVQHSSFPEGKTVVCSKRDSVCGGGVSVCWWVGGVCAVWGLCVGVWRHGRRSVQSCQSSGSQSGSGPGGSQESLPPLQEFDKLMTSPDDSSTSSSCSVQP